MFIAYEHVDNNEIRKMIKDLNRTGLLEKKIILQPNMRKAAYVRAFISEGIEKCFDSGLLDSVPEHIYEYYLKIAIPDKKPPKEDAPSTEQEPQEQQEEPKKVDTEQLELKIDSEASEEPTLPDKVSESGTTGEAATKKKATRKKQTATRKKQTAKAKDAPKRPAKKARKTKPARKAKAPKIAAKRGRTQKKRGRGRPPGAPNKTSEIKKKLAEEKAVVKVARNAKTAGFTRAKVFADIVTDQQPRTKKEIVSEMNQIYGGSEAEASYWVGGYCGVLIALGKMVKHTDGTFIYGG